MPHMPNLSGSVFTPTGLFLWVRRSYSSFFLLMSRTLKGRLDPLKPASSIGAGHNDILIRKGVQGSSKGVQESE